MPIDMTSYGTDLASGIKTDKVDEPDRKGFRVTWINWDSDFRASGLRIQDLIIAVDGKRCDEMFDPKLLFKAIGQYAENQQWAEVGAKDGQAIRLDVLRDDTPLQISGKLQALRSYCTPEERRAMAAGGPDELAKDGFDDSWSGWYEKLAGKLSYILDGGWERRSLVNRFELEEHEAHKPRVDYLLAHYPGPFANATLDDWTRARDSLLGRGYEVGEADLEYRSIGEKRVETAKQEAARAVAAFRDELAKETIPAFPAADIDARGSVIGKIVELPWITYREFINDLGKSFAVAGSSSEGFYFVELERKDAYRFFDTMFRYKGQVNPKLPERYQFFGRIQDDPRMLSFQRRPVAGLVIEPLGVLAGDDELFVDLRKTNAAGRSEFAGETILSRFDPIELGKDATPAQTIEAMIRAIKLGDEKTWRGLFADWRVVTGSGGRSIIDHSYMAEPCVFSSEWERSRQLIMGEVHDARVQKVERIRRLLERDPSIGLPQVEATVVWIDHINPFRGEYRSFNNVNVHRQWELQRLDQGPWRITNVQNL